MCIDGTITFLTKLFIKTWFLSAFDIHTDVQTVQATIEQEQKNDYRLHVFLYKKTVNKVSYLKRQSVL